VGTSTSAAQFAGKLRKAAVVVQDQTRDGVNETARVGVMIFQSSLPASSLRNMGGAKLGAYMKPAKSTSNPEALVGYSGPVHILNNDIDPHAIYPRGLRVRDSSGEIGRTNQGRRLTAGRRKGTAKGLTLPGGNVRLYANHPGTTGKRFFELIAKPGVQRAHGRVHQMGMSRALRKVF